METEKRLIDPSRIIRSLKAMASEYDAIALHGIIKALNEEPAVDAVEMPDAQVRKAVELLCKNYEAAKKKPFVQHPLAYALFHTWKEIDNGRK